VTTIPTQSTTAPNTEDPILAELRERNAALDSPLSPAGPLWDTAYRQKEIDVAAFRADNAYLWQTRHGYAGPHPRLTYLLYAHYLDQTDPRGLLERLGEDGAFGAVTIAHTRPPLLSRDLLDSVNELAFLDRTCHLFDQAALTVLDIGAGYGRLAHRMIQAGAPLRHYLCADAVPESTYLCHWYLHHRGVAHTAQAIPLDHLHQRLAGVRVDLAVNVRSFTEMPATVISAWLDLLDDLAVPTLFVVPNDSNYLRSREHGGTRHDMIPDLRRRGWRITLDEPFILDPDIRAFTGRNEHHMLLSRP
jgi:hypothetical protein